MAWKCLPHLSVAATSVLLGCAAEGEPNHLSYDRLEHSNTCAFRPSGSSWIDPSRMYEPRAEFGRIGGGELADIWGIASTVSGSVFVFDAGQRRILELTDDLRLAREFGREGSGPGEFRYQRVASGDWVATTDSSLLVLHLGAISEFSFSGDFLRYVSHAPPFISSIKRIASFGEKVIAGSDMIDRSTGARQVESWLFSEIGSPELLRVDEMPPLPRENGRLVRGIFALQAEPLWASHANCVYISDGASDSILRVDLLTNRADTLRLPARDIPALTADDHALVDRMRRELAMMGASTGSSRTEPTARVKWNAMVVDPDGYIWLEPWRSPSLANEPFTVWVVHPARGSVDSVVVGSFPKAFLPDGGFVTSNYDEATSLTHLRSYRLQRAHRLPSPR